MHRLLTRLCLRPTSCVVRIERAAEFGRRPRSRVTLPWKGRIARPKGGRGGVSFRRLARGSPHPGVRIAREDARERARAGTPTLPFQGRVTVLHGFRANSGARAMVTTHLVALRQSFVRSLCTD